MSENLDIIKQIKKDFDERFIAKFKGKTDPDEILYYQNVLDNPNELNKELTEIPSLYAYWASLKREALQEVDRLKNNVSMIEHHYFEDAITRLKNKGAKTYTQVAISEEVQIIIKAKAKTNDELCKKYLGFKKKLKEMEDTYESIGVIERAVLTKKECLKTIADLTSNMMNNGIYVYKDPNQKKGGF